MTKRLLAVALAGAAVLSFAPPASADLCSLEECLELLEPVTGPIHYTGDCIWFDTFPVCKPL